MPEHALRTPADSVTRDVVAAVADATGRDPETLPPLYGAVDPDALEALVNRPPQIGRDPSEIEVTFGYADCVVTVAAGDGVVVSAELAADADTERLTPNE